MSVFTVKAASVKKEIPDAKFGPAKVIALVLQNGDGEKQAEWFTKATTPIPTEGSTLEGELESGNYGLNFKKASGGGFGGGVGMTPERQRAIQRQHSQEMAIRTLDILQRVNGKVPDDESIRRWADWFDADVNAVSAGTGGGGSTAPSNRSDPTPVAGSSARGFVVKPDGTSPQKEHFERLLKKAGAKPETASNIVLYVEENWTADGAIREAFDGLTDPATARPTTMAIAKRAEEWAANQPAVPEADTRDLPEPDGSVSMPDDEDIPF